MATLAVVAATAGCVPASTTGDAGSIPRGDAGALAHWDGGLLPLPSGPLFCTGELSVRIEDPVAVADEPVTLWPAGSAVGPAFLFSTSTTAGLVFPRSPEAPMLDLPAVRGDLPVIDGDTVTFFDFRGEPEVRVVDLSTRTVHAARPWTSPIRPDRMARRAGGWLAATATDYHPLDEAFEADGPPVRLELDGPPDLLLPTDGAILSVFGGGTQWLDPSGAPAERPLFLEVFSAWGPLALLWDGSRVVFPSIGHQWLVAELDARGRPASFTPTPAWVAFGHDEGLVIVDEAGRITLVERFSGVERRVLAELPAEIHVEAIALGEGGAWLAYSVPRPAGRVGVVRIECGGR